MGIKSLNPKVKQNQRARELVYSTSSLQQYRQDIIMLSSYKIPSNSHKRRPKILNTNLDDFSNREYDLRRPQLASNDLKRPQIIELVNSDSNTDSAVNRITNKEKKKWKGGSMHDIGEFNDKKSEEILHINNL